MTIQTLDGMEIDTESQMYKDYLRDLEDLERLPNVREPAPFRTLGDVIELERRRHEHDAQTKGQQQLSQETSIAAKR